MPTGRIAGGARVDTDVVFRGANLAVMPFWFLMLAVPNTRLARAVMRNRLVFVVIGSVYAAMLVKSLRGGEREDLLELVRNPSPEKLGEFFSAPDAVVAGWVHYLAFDLFVGRWIYLDSGERGRRTPRLALLLTFVAGPAGLLLYLLERAVLRARLDETAVPV